MFLTHNTFIRSHRNSVAYVHLADTHHICALQKSLLSYSMRTTPSIVCPSVGMCFESLTEAYDFYNFYSWEIGFGIRYGRSWLNVTKIRAMQEFNCLCRVCTYFTIYNFSNFLLSHFTLLTTLLQGIPRRKNRKSIRTGCPSMIRLSLRNDNRWYISEFRSYHNHSLSTTDAQKMHWQSHRHIDKYLQDLITNMRTSNVHISKIYMFLGSFFG